MDQSQASGTAALPSGRHDVQEEGMVLVDLVHGAEAGVVPAPVMANPTAGAVVRSRLKWLPISTRMEGTARGVARVVHPFLVNQITNWMDVMLVRHLIVEQPFAASFGKSGSAWKDFAFDLSLVQDPDGKLVYGTIGISDKGAKKRFEDLMDYVKKEQNDVPFQSGCDDQAPSTDLENALDDLYEIYCEKKNDAKVSSNSTAAQKAEDNARAEVLRNASLGMLTPQQKSGLQERRSGGKGVEDTDNTSTPATGNKKRAASSTVIDLMEGASERFRKRQESQVAREARKKEKQDNKQARQDKVFDLKKADAERADKEFQFKKDEAERAHELQKLQFEVNKEMLLFLRSRPPPNPDQNGGDKLV
jgi:hypothetical protein